MSYQPIHAQPAKTNVYDAEEFITHALFGATSITTVFGKDVVLVRNSAGNYTLIYPQKYRKLIKFGGHMAVAAGATLFPVLVTDAVGTAHATAPNGGSITFELRTAAGVATDPTTGDKLLLTTSVSRNVLNDEY